MTKQAKLSDAFKELQLNEYIIESWGAGTVYGLRQHIVRFQHKTGRKFTTKTIKDDPELRGSPVTGLVITRIK